MAEQNAYQVADWNGQSAERRIAYQARLDATMAIEAARSPRANACWTSAAARGAMC
jgi:hypothetical protein